VFVRPTDLGVDRAFRLSCFSLERNLPIRRVVREPRPSSRDVRGGVAPEETHGPVLRVLLAVDELMREKPAPRGRAGGDLAGGFGGEKNAGAAERDGLRGKASRQRGGETSGAETDRPIIAPGRPSLRRRPEEHGASGQGFGRRTEASVSVLRRFAICLISTE
jgi:hypothetical protein